MSNKKQLLLVCKSRNGDVMTNEWTFHLRLVAVTTTKKKAINEDEDDWRQLRMQCIYLNRLCASNSREIDHLISSVRIMRVLITKQCLVDLPRSFGAHPNDFVPVELHFDHIHTSDNIHRFHCLFSCLWFLLIVYVLFFFSFYWFGHWGREIIILLGEMKKKVWPQKKH